MGQITKIDKKYDDFFLIQIEDINWDEAEANWDSFYADEYYSKYLKAEYNVDVPPPYEVLWDQAILLTISVGGKYNGPEFGWTKEDEEKKKTIKLIFMMDDFEKVFEKEKDTKVEVEFKNKVENQLSEQLGHKVLLEDVQIIHR